MSDTQPAAPVRTPTVYFIDDSATMREVIKIAFRKENIHVITCPDAVSALAQFRENPPDAVITDVIMPDKDGYEVCEFIKRQEEFAAVPVILMSGVVNRAVAERAMAVKADELIRKPFQPQDLIIRVKKLLNPNAAGIIRGEDPEIDPSADAKRSGSHALSSLFGPSQAPSSNTNAACLPLRESSRRSASAGRRAMDGRTGCGPESECRSTRGTSKAPQRSSAARIAGEKAARRT